MNARNYFMIRTPEGHVGYWDGDLLAGKGLSTNCPRSKALTFDSAAEAMLWAERINASTGLSPEVIDRNGTVHTLAETDGLVSSAPSTPTPLETAQAMVAALIEVRPDLRFKGYGDVIDAMHAAMEAYAHNHAWSMRLAFNCEQMAQRTFSD